MDKKVKIKYLRWNDKEKRFIPEMVEGIFVKYTRAKVLIREQGILHEKEIEVKHLEFE